MQNKADLLLEGPRGRRLCLELAKEVCPDVRTAASGLAYELDPGKGSSTVLLTDGHPDASAPASPKEFAAAIASLDPGALNDVLMQSALQQAVASARYWQEPEGEDVLAGHPAVVAALYPVAEQVMDSSTGRHWCQPRRIEQWAIDWRSGEDPPPLPKDPQRTLAEWGQGERAEEARAAKDRPDAPGAPWSGTWWSIPQGLLQTVGQIPAGLDLVEDSLGWEDATTVPVRGVGRTYQIHTGDNWIDLCRAFPLDVTASRRHDWYRATGRAGRWVIPDWGQVAQEWDAVHLTVFAYLNGATRPLWIDSGRASVIAGWNPDTTIWLTDVAREWEGPRHTWHRAPQDGCWSPVSPQTEP